MEKILLQRIVIGCLFLHELPLMYHELSLIVCFTRISINVPRIVINCFGDIASGCGWLQQPCHADVGLCSGGHLLLHAGVPLRFTTCLDTILRYAVVYGKPKPPKKGVANQKIFSYMLEMHYELIGIGLVKMMIGVKRTGEKIQYCITAIEA